MNHLLSQLVAIAIRPHKVNYMFLVHRAGHFYSKTLVIIYIYKYDIKYISNINN